MRTSRQGLLFIARREGLVLSAYQDGEHMSIGFGSNDPKLREGDQITVKDAFTRLKKDVERREGAVERALKRPVTQEQWDAVFSLYYQGGSDGLMAVANHINNNEMKLAAEEFLSWDTNAAGVHMPGLLKRRRLEQDIFLNGDYGDLNPIPYWVGDPRKTARDEYYVTEDDL